MNLLTPTKSIFSKNQTGFWDNIFTFEQIQYILALPCWTEAAHGKIGTADQSKINFDVRQSRTAWMPRDNQTEIIYNALAHNLAQANAEIFNFELKGFSEIQCGIYSGTDQDHYSWHADSSYLVPGMSRKLSVSILLDDVSTFEGGKMEVKLDSNESVELEQRLGRALLFPSYMLHRVTPVTKGVRRSLVVWLVGPDFR